MSREYARTEIKKMCLRERQLPIGHMSNKSLKVYLMIEEKKRRNL